MPQAFAISTVHVLRVPAEKDDKGKVITAPKIEVVPAGKVCDLTADQFKELVAAGAVRAPTKMDAAISEGPDLPAAIETEAGKPAATLAQPVPARPAR